MTSAPAPSAGTGRDIGAELLKEGNTMSLYIAVSLLAALTAVSDSAGRADVEVVGIIWGTTIGLALAHFFAFRVSARLVGSGRVGRHDMQIALAQLIGAAAVAALCTVPIMILNAASELDGVRVVLAGYVALVGYGVAMGNGSTRPRAISYAAVVLVVALSIVMVKNLLVGH